MTARKNANAGCRWFEDPALPEGRRDAVIMKPIRLTDVPVHPAPRRRRRSTTPSGAPSNRSYRVT
jgi:hypothetical protein